MHFSFVFATFVLASVAYAAPLNANYSTSLEPYLTRASEFSARADTNLQILKVGIRFNDARGQVAPTYRNGAPTAQRNSDPLHYRFNVPNRIVQPWTLQYRLQPVSPQLFKALQSILYLQPNLVLWVQCITASLFAVVIGGL
ncbi:hypothetical protein LENED_005158 [Lentinula edodes]|uniref:Uncharacterized protein n=1 Tax=Lentinula edodes TaxID=5353 RepID=A0A1Q3E892_LENED|nr:hypothetical protein LENED_005158 [Lentinula edodes]